MPAESSPASTWIGARNFPAIPNVPNWNDWAVRFAAAYDLFGTGKTALKANVGKYVAAQAAGYAADVQRHERRRRRPSPGPTSTATAPSTTPPATSRSTRSVRGTANFGQITSRPDPALARGYNWEYSAVLQHELIPRMSVTVGYYHRDFYNLQVTDNQNLALSDWTALLDRHADRHAAAALRPADSVVQPEPDKVGVATDNLLTYSTANKTTYNGVEFTANVRRDKFIIFGGVTTDRRIDDHLRRLDATDAASAPRQSRPTAPRFCDAAARRSARRSRRRPPTRSRTTSS